MITPTHIQADPLTFTLRGFPHHPKIGSLPGSCFDRSVIEVHCPNGITFQLNREISPEDLSVVYRTVAFSQQDGWRQVEGIYEYTDDKRGDAAHNQREGLKFIIGVFCLNTWTDDTND